MPPAPPPRSASLGGRPAAARALPEPDHRQEQGRQEQERRAGAEPEPGDRDRKITPEVPVHRPGGLARAPERCAETRRRRERQKEEPGAPHAEDAPPGPEGEIHARPLKQ